jgi:hypothetical protein
VNLLIPRTGEARGAALDDEGEAAGAAGQSVSQS